MVDIWHLPVSSYNPPTLPTYPTYHLTITVFMVTSISHCLSQKFLPLLRSAVRCSLSWIWSSASWQRSSTPFFLAAPIMFPDMGDFRVWCSLLSGLFALPCRPSQPRVEIHPLDRDNDFKRAAGNGVMAECQLVWWSVGLRIREDHTEV